MKFSDIIDQACTLLQGKGRLTYRSLKLEFGLDDEQLDVLKEELIYGQRVAVDEGGKVLVWVGEGSPAPRVLQPATPTSQSPRTDIPPPLADRSRTESSAVTVPHGTAGERRQLTVMFVDLVGSTTLSTHLDPEDYHTVVQRYHQTCETVIQRYGGFVPQHLGDGLLVYFGYPIAHEDDAQRAVRTALDIIKAIQQLSFPTIRLPHSVQVRIGIHTGLVVIGEIGGSEKREMLALGETPNLAARLQSLGKPDTVVISATTYRLIEGLLDCRDLGAQSLKGISTPVQVYEVVGESGLRSRLDVAMTRGLTPLVGRDEEVELLRRRWEQTKAGEGQVVLLSGEAGIGKSRLLQALREQLSSDTHTRLECRCSPFHQHSAFYPVIDLLQRVLQFRREDTAEEKLAKLETTLVGEHSRAPAPETVSLFASLLSLPLPAHSPRLTLTPQKQKEKTQQALLTLLLQEAERQPVRFDVEDVHWADPSTLEFLSLLLECTTTARLLVLFTFRPDFIPPWALAAHVTQLSLRRLGRKQVEAMVERLASGKPLSEEIVQQLITRTDGVPLFVEELTKNVLETVGAPHHAPRQLVIPATLQDSLMARLDRMSTAKEVAQLGATIGREFSYELLHAVSPLDEVNLQHALAKLVEAELLYQRGMPPQARYFFKHALIQDAAYQALLKSTRQQYHSQIAQTLGDRFPEIKNMQPELLAQHYTEAGLLEHALPYWQQAGERATQRSAYVEAVAHLTKGLAGLKALPDAPERVQQELTLQLALHDALVVVKGYATPEVGTAVSRTRELCQQLGETPQLFPVLMRLRGFYLIQAEYQTARELAEQLMRLAQSVQDQYLLSLAHWELATTSFWLGELTSARPHLEQAIALYDPQQHPHFTIGTADPRVNCLSYASWTLWTLGYPDQALKRSQEAVALAAELAHPFSLAYALGTAAWFHVFRREEQLVRERAEAVMTLSTEQGFPFWLPGGMMIQGWALAEQGQEEEGIAQIRQGLAAHQTMGTKVARSCWLTLLVEAYGKVGRVEEGLHVLAEALAVVDSTGERFYEAELYRLRGELTLQRANQKAKGKSRKAKISHVEPLSSTQAEADAEACFLKAIDIAQKQQAKSLELRAATSLARLWQRQGKRIEAHQLLSEIYNWFTEGFDTKDLQEAKALLEELT